MYKTRKRDIVVIIFLLLAAPAASASSYSLTERLSLINSYLDDMEVAQRGQDSLSSAPVASFSSTASGSGDVQRKAPSVKKASPFYARKVVRSPAYGWEKAFKVKGEIRMGLGIEDDNVFAMRADGNLNERNWRLIDSNALNRMENTFDPGVYSRLKVVVDAVIKDSVRMHLNVTADPWSYTGKSSPLTVTSSWNDQATFQYLTWGGTRYTVPQSLNTRLLGDSTGVGEIKVKGGKVPPTTVKGNWGLDPWKNTFNIPEADIDYTFNPLRELWFDFKTGDKGYVRVFPMAYDNQALTSDDPLRLSNNKSYWEESPWLRQWAEGNYNRNATSGGLPQPSFTKGKWDRSLANYSRDSDGQWLTALRGVALDMKPNEDATLKAVVATPKTLWQEYSDMTAVPGSIRLKQFLSDRLFVGVTGNMHLGLVNDSRVDAENYVRSVDVGVVPIDGMEISAQASSSRSVYDQTNSLYRSTSRGEAYMLSMELASYGEDVLNKDYFGLIAPKGAPSFFKTRMFFGKMDHSFESSLANYHETRSDAFWSRHITFYPSPYRNLPGSSPTMSHYDLEPFAIGNGLDYGRRVVGWRGDALLLDGRLKGLADTRYVMGDDAQHKKIEAVSRTQWEYQATEKLLAKILLLNHSVPKTTDGKDPFITSGETGLPLDNDAVDGGQDASLNTGTLGLRYQATNWLAWNGVWERTNDFTEGADNHPNGILNAAYNETYTHNGLVYNRAVPFLYSQGYFDQAPYEYHNIFKTGIELTPNERWNVYLDYTRNPNKFAGNIDDHSNHFGLESSYKFSDKWGVYGRYTLTRMYDLGRLVHDDVLDYQTYHNLFFEARYCHNKDSRLSLMYGVGPSYNIGVQGINPTLAYYSAPSVATQHIVRLLYQQKF